MTRDARTGGPGFPETRRSVIEAMRDDDPAVRRVGFEALVRGYWRPVYTYLRLRGRLPAEEAEDLTQGFFAHALEKRVLDAFDPERARFRTWLRTCLDGYRANERKAAGRRKRGGDLRHLPLDFPALEGELARRRPAPDDDPDRLFHREWLRGLLALAVDDLRGDETDAGRAIDFEIFRRYDLEGSDADRRPTYREIASELGVPVTKVTNALHAERRRFREAALRRLRRICASDREFRAEARELFGLETP